MFLLTMILNGEPPNTKVKQDFLISDYAKMQSRQLGICQAGYLSYITDTRNRQHLRFYIGQLKKLSIRIQQHIYAMSQEHNTALHYHVTLKYPKYLSANFIRLWSMQISTIDDLAKDCILCILELILDRAFQSFPSKTLEKYFGKLQDAESILRSRIEHS